MLPSITRRTFINTTLAAGASLLLPKTGMAAVPQNSTPTSPNWNRILIHIYLAGGNDGLNTIIPYQNATYQSIRPKIGVKDLDMQDSVLGDAPMMSGTNNLIRPMAMNPSLYYHLKDAWTSNDMAIVLGVGMDAATGSHFRGTDYWVHGTNVTPLPGDGWLGRLYSQNQIIAQTQFDLHGATVGGSSRMLQGNNNKLGTLDSMATILNVSVRDTSALDSLSPHLKYYLQQQQVLKGLQSKVRNSVSTYNQPKNNYTFNPPDLGPGVAFGPGGFESDCQLTAQLITTLANSDPLKRIQIPAFSLAIGSFDFHGNQGDPALPFDQWNHNDLLAQLGSGIKNLRQALMNAKDPLDPTGINTLWDRTLIVTGSEFGRRTFENGAMGTDHGTANCHFIIGSNKYINHGFYGAQPGIELSDLNQIGNMAKQVDFSSYYATVAQWFGFDTSVDPYLGTFPPIAGVFK